MKKVSAFTFALISLLGVCLAQLITGQAQIAANSISLASLSSAIYLLYRIYFRKTKE
jgi:hypothetical protein